MSRTITRRKIGENLYSVSHKCDGCGKLLFKTKEEVIPQTWINRVLTKEQINEQNWHRVWRGLTVVAYICDKCFEQYMQDNPKCTSNKTDYFKKGVEV